MMKKRFFMVALVMCGVARGMDTGVENISDDRKTTFLALMALEDAFYNTVGLITRVQEYRPKIHYKGGYGGCLSNKGLARQGLKMEIGVSEPGEKFSECGPDWVTTPWGLRCYRAGCGGIVAEKDRVQCATEAFKKSLALTKLGMLRTMRDSEGGIESGLYAYRIDAVEDIKVPPYESDMHYTSGKGKLLDAEWEVLATWYEEVYLPAKKSPETAPEPAEGSPFGS